MIIRRKFLVVFSLIALLLIVVGWSLVKTHLQAFSIGLLHQYSQVVNHYRSNSTLDPIIREVELVRQVSLHPNIITWAENAEDSVYIDVATDTLEQFRWQLLSKNFFVALDSNLAYYFNSTENIRESASLLRYHLNPEQAEDQWYFKHKQRAAPFGVNINHDHHLGITKLWINQSIIKNGQFLGIVGTGLSLEPFMDGLFRENAIGVDTLFVDELLNVQLIRDANIQFSDDFKGKVQGKPLSAFIQDPNDYVHVVQAINAQKNGAEPNALLVDYNDSNSLVSINYIKPLNWFEVTFINMDSLLASTNVTLLCCVLLLTLVGFLLTIWLVIELTFLRPFARLVKAAQQYRTQDYPIQFTYKPHSEIGDVMRFIEKLTKGILHGQANIDRLVAIRTSALDHLSTIDPLTQLLNKKGMEAEIKSELARVKRENSHFGLLWIDIGKYGTTAQNDKCVITDSQLIQVTDNINLAIREYDSAGRWADNEFLIVVRSESYNSLLALSKRLTELSSNSVGAENSTSIDLSIGGALINGGCSITEALAKADTALYMAKQSKECQVYIWQEGSHVA